MKKFQHIVALVFFVLFSWSMAVVGGFGVSYADSVKHQEDQVKITNLTRLLKSIDGISASIEEKNRKLSSPEGQGREQALRQDIQKLSQKLEVLENNFNDLASEINYEAIVNPQKPKSFNWNDELKEILGPLIREIQRATSKPREIEKHRSDIETYDYQLENIRRAMDHLRNLAGNPDIQPRLRDKLTESLAMWEARQNDVETLKSISNLQLDKIRKETESLTQTVQKIPGIFFKSHGRNLLFALFALLVSAYGFFRLFSLVRRYSPFHKDEKSLYSRAFDLGYTIIASFLCLVVVLAVLYFCSDWVLLSIAILFLIGIVWTSKSSLPRAWNQARLILNLGPVREGELVVYNGIPYKVASINMYSSLYNPAITSARIRLPIADLESLRSRPVDKNEPWFPSRAGDYVLFNGDGTERLGRVVVQTPETVLVEFAGGGKQAISSSSYFSSPPVNLSSGFRARFLFGLDYDLQNRMTTDIPDEIKKAVEEKLIEKGFKEPLAGVFCEFRQAAASSLDLEVAADFTGDVAADYMRITRIMQMACVEACTGHGWNIPFNQMTVHMADKHS